MRVGLALHYVREGKVTGVERYGLSVASGVSELSRPALEFQVLASAAAARRLRRSCAHVVSLPGDWRLIGEQAILPLWAVVRGLDLLHVPAFGGAAIRRTPFVLNVHDSVFWDAPATLSTLGRYYYRPAVEGAIRSPLLRATLYQSHSALDAVAHHFPRLRRTAYVCYCATELESARGPRVRRDRADGPLRILSVGTLEPRKNFPAMSASIARLGELLGRKVEWQIVGRRGWLSATELAMLRQPHVTWTPAADDTRLLALYRQADLFLSLSHMEGFNIPLLEAMAQGTPAVVSDLAVHREIGDAAASYAPLGDVEATARQMSRLLREDQLWEEHSSSGWVQAQKFTPGALANRVADVYAASV